MLIAILALITALAISSVAIYYSVAGLVAIFAAAAIPIIIMGGVLEVSKLVTAVWLHRNWNIATWWLKTYLSTAVIILMAITSIGIFGFLSKAHIEQTAGAQQSVAQIEQITERIERNQSIVQQSEQRIQELQTSGSGVETNIREQIQAAQQRIDSAYERVQPAIQQQREIIAEQTQNLQRQINSIEQNLNQLDSYIADGEIEKAQAVIGVEVDGDYGPNTALAYREYRAAQQERKDQLVNRIETSLDNNQTVQRARNRIQQLEQQAESQVAQATATIEQLRTRLNSNTQSNAETLIAQQTTRMSEASAELEELTEKKFELETSYRQLEAEVGPIKYIAEFVYGEEADGALLEKAVQWIIIFIIFVFDPLAVLLLLASQYTFEHLRKQRPPKKQKYKLDDLAAQYKPTSPEPQTEDEPDRTIEAPELDYVRENWDTSSEQDVTDEDLGKLEDDLVSELADDDHDEVSEEFKQAREQLYNEKEQDERFADKKTKWKAEHPEETLKHYKKLYVHGVIDSLPWE